MTSNFKTPSRFRHYYTFPKGFIVPLVRGDLKWAAIMFLLGAITSVPTLGLGIFIVDAVFAFIYNKIYIKELVEKGYKPADQTAYEALKELGLQIARPGQPESAQYEPSAASLTE